MSASPFDEFCRAAFDLLDAAATPYLVIGGLAVIAVGEPRLTGAADVIALISPDEMEPLMRRAREVGFEVDLDLERERLSRTGTARLKRPPFQLDIILASLPFEDAALNRAVTRHP